MGLHKTSSSLERPPKGSLADSLRLQMLDTLDGFYKQEHAWVVALRRSLIMNERRCEDVPSDDTSELHISEDKKSISCTDKTAKHEEAVDPELPADAPHLDKSHPPSTKPTRPSMPRHSISEDSLRPHHHRVRWSKEVSPMGSSWQVRRLMSQEKVVEADYLLDVLDSFENMMETRMASCRRVKNLVTDAQRRAKWRDSRP